MKKIYTQYFLLIVLLMATQKLEAQTPTITSFSPSSGPSGTAITITGTNFNNTPANNIVIFGATRATVNAATATQLTVTVPAGATFQPISVLVNGLQAFSSKPFIVTFPGIPAIVSGTFGPKADFGTLGGSESVASGDFDGDGKADLVVAQTSNPGESGIGIFRNTSNGEGNINFATRIDLFTDVLQFDYTITRSVAVADFDGDGKLDFVVSKRATDDVAVFRNTSSGPGNISFAEKVDFASAETPYWLTVGDMDGDGKPDIVVANATSNSVSVLRNTSTGTGNISFAAKVDFTTGNEPRHVTIGDIDGDGKPDLAVSCTAGNVVSVLRNTSSAAGTVSFATKLDFNVNQAYSAAIGDLNGNGNADLAVVSYFPNEISVFRYNGTGPGNISYAAKVIFPSSNNAVNIAMADMDGDGKLDLAVANQGFLSVAILRNTNAGTSAISFADKVDFATAQNPSAISIVDLDGDGKNDMAVSTQFGVMSVLRNKGDVTAPVISSFSPLDNAINVTANSNLVITFNEPIQKGSGFIIVREEGDVKDIIDVSSEKVSIEGITVTIEPVPFTPGANVNIEFAPGVFKDLNDNEHGGIADPTIWNFTVLSGSIEPTAQPTNLTFTSVTATSFTVNYTAATGSPAGYIAVRRAGSAPTTDPVDGTGYTAGATLGDGIIAFIGTAATFNESGLTASTTYHYKIYSYNGTGSSVNYRQAAPLSGSQTTAAAANNNPADLDTSIDFGSGANGPIFSLDFQTDGKMLVGGDFIQFAGNVSNRLERLLATGAVDLATFDPGSGANDWVRNVIALPDGKILIAGDFTTFNTIPVNFLLRLNANGSIDNTFSQNPGPNDWIRSMNRQSDGKIIIAGDFTLYDGVTTNYIDRINADGTLDLAGFNPGTGANNFIFSTALQADGKIIIGGIFTTYDGTSRNGIARLNNDGSLDTGFNPGSGASAAVYGITVQADGKIIITGEFTTFNGVSRNGVARLNADGTLDTTFNPGTGATALVYTSTVQSDGKILLGGLFAVFNGLSRSGIVRLNSDGSVDTSFDPQTGFNDYVSYLRWEDNKVWATGAFTSYRGTPRGGIARIFAPSEVTLASEPSAQPTNLTFASVTASSFTVNFNAASPVSDGIIAIRRDGAAPTTDPVDGTAYTVGAALGNGIVAFVGSATTFNETGLSASTTYHYKIYSYNGTGSATNYRQTSPLTGSQATAAGLATEPSSQPTNLTFASVTASSFTVNYTASSPVAEGYIAIRRDGAAPTTDPVDGTAYTVGSALGNGVVAFVGSATTFNETGLSASTTYHYKIYSYNGTGSATNYRQTTPLTGSQATAAGLATEPSAQPTNLTFASVTASSFTVNYTASSPAAEGYIAIRRDAAASTTDPVDGTAYTVGSALGNGVVAFVGSANTFNDTGLSANTTYHYKIYSYNGTGSATNYRQTTPLTGSQATIAGLATEPAAQPTNLTFASVTAASFTVNYTAASPTSESYIAIRRDGAAPTTDPVDGTAYTLGATLGNGVVTFVGSATTFNETGLSSSTTYHYKIYSFNGTGNSINYRQTSPLTGSQSTSAAGGDTTPPVFSNNTTPAAVNAGSPVSVSVNISDPESGISSATISFGPANSTNFSTSNSAMTNSTGNTWTFSIPATAQSEIGVRYQITATNAAGLDATIGPLVVGVNQTGTGLSIPFNSFGSAVSNYRIIAVPLNLQNKSVNAVFSPTLGNYGDRTKWRMYHYSSSQTNELNGNSLLDLGKGYWLISKENVSLNTGPGQTVGSIDNPHSISLSNGWNQIGNPYTFNLLWSDVTAANTGLSIGALRVYNGSFNNGNRLDAFQGGFIFVNSGSTLVFPAAKNASINSGRFDDTPEEEPLRSNSIDSDDWEVRFSLSSGELFNNLSGLGMHPEAQEAFDQFDDFTLPRFIEYLELSHDKILHRTKFSRDIVPASEKHVWSFEVNTSHDNQLTVLNWDNSYFNNTEKQLVLWDEQKKQSVDMSLFSSYTFIAPAKFKVYYGDASFIKEQIIQHELIFHDPYPNPSSGLIHFSFVIPDHFDETEISLEMFDQTGSRVAIPAAGVFQAGFHQVSWNMTDEGKNITNGLYLIRLKSHQHSLYKKILIIRQ